MLLIGFVGEIRDGASRSDLLNPLHLRGVVCLKTPGINFAEPLPTQGTDSATNDGIRYQTLHRHKEYGQLRSCGT